LLAAMPMKVPAARPPRRPAARAPPSPACAEGASAIIVAAVISKTLRVLRKLRPSKFTEFDRESATGLVNIMLTVPALGERARFESLLLAALEQATRGFSAEPFFTSQIKYVSQASEAAMPASHVNDSAFTRHGFSHPMASATRAASRRQPPTEPRG
jgi:hypothetical protein